MATPAAPLVAPAVPECVWPTVTNEELQSAPLSDFPCAKWTSELVSQAGHCVGADITALHREATNLRELTGNVCYNFHYHINDLRTKSTDMKNELSGYKQDADAAKESITQIQTQVDKLMAELPLTPLCSDTEAQKEVEMKEIRATLNKLRADVDILHKYERYNALIATMDARFARLQSKNALWDARIREIDQREELKQLREDNARLEARLSALEEKEVVAKAMVELRDKVFEEFMERTQASHNELRSTADTLREDVTELQNEDTKVTMRQYDKETEECNDQIATLQLRCQGAEKTATSALRLMGKLRPSLAQILHDTEEQRAVCTALRSDHETLQARVKDSVDMLLAKSKESPSQTQMDTMKDAIVLLQSQASANSPIDSISLIHQDVERVKHILCTPTAKFVEGERSVVLAFLELFSLLEQVCAMCRGPKEGRTVLHAAAQSVLMPESTLKPEPVKHVAISTEESLLLTPPTSTASTPSEATGISSGSSVSRLFDRDCSPLTDIDEKDDGERLILTPEERRLSSRKRTQRNLEGPSQRYPSAKRPRTKYRVPQESVWPAKTPQGEVANGMINCDSCHGWLHNRCACLRPDDLLAYKNPRKKYTCPFCFFAKKNKIPPTDRTPHGREVCIWEDCTTIPDPDAYFMESIQGRFRVNPDDTWKYLIKWDGYLMEENTWEDFNEHMALLEDLFHKKATKEGFDVDSPLSFVLAEAEPLFGLANTDDVKSAAG